MRLFLDVDDAIEASTKEEENVEGGWKLPTNISEAVSQTRNGGEEISSSEVETLFEVEPQVGTCGYTNNNSGGAVHRELRVTQFVGAITLALFLGPL